MSGTFFDKVWDQHVIAELGNGVALLHIDRHLLHDLSGARGLTDVLEAGHRVRNPELTFATPDHAVSTAPGRNDETVPHGTRLIRGLREGSAQSGIRFFDINDEGQGIVHIIGPEQGITLPGAVLVCGDSHTCTHGGVGALAFGIGSSEVAHVLATQALVQRKPKRMRVSFDGTLGPAVTPKDLILFLIGRIGAGAGNGHAVEYAGAAIRRLPIEGRLTICNLSIELGAKIGMVAPDDVVYQYLAGRQFAPTGALWDQALAHWRALAGDRDAAFDRDVEIDVAEIRPQITWGNSPQDVISVDGHIPDPATAADGERRAAITAALAYMDLEPGTPIEGVAIDRVFIGSCTNSRLSDLREAAGLAKGGRVAAHVDAWVVPGSQAVKRAAEREGLDRIFTDAGFAWREPGCSMCVGANGEIVAPGQRCVSTSNRNFIGRQGPGSRTHLASPVTAVASALRGQIADPRKLGT